MGGRFLDWLGQGNTAGRPVAADMPARIVPNSTALYFDNQALILNVFNEDTTDWIQLDIGVLAAVMFSTLPDVDWSTPPTDQQLFRWNTTSSKLEPFSFPSADQVEAIQDLVAAMAVNGTGFSAAYDDGTGLLTLSVTITQYTDELAQDAIAAALAAGTQTGLSVTYDDVANTLSFAISDAYVNALIAAAVPALASASEIWVGTDNTKFISPQRIADVSAFIPLVDGATIAIDGDTGFNFSVTLGGSRTIANPVNMFEGQSGLIAIAQDGTGSRVATWGSNWRFAGGAAVGGVLSTTANAVDLLSYTKHGSVFYGSILKDVKA